MAGSWSSGGNLNTARYYLAGCGTQSAGLSFGGYTTAATNTTEEYSPDVTPTLTAEQVGEDIELSWTC